MPLQEYAARDGVMAYVRRGLGDPLLLIHGVYPGASHHEFDANISAWAARHTVYAPDLLGFGQSDTPRRAHSAQQHQHLLRDFLRDVVGGPAAVLGSGLGAGIAARLGVYDDTLVRRLVLIAPPNKEQYHEPPGLADRFSRFLLGTLNVGGGLYSVAASRPGLREFLKDSYHDRRQIRRETIEQMFEEANEPHKMMAYISALCGYFDVDLSRWLPSVRRPTLLVVGQDRLPVPEEIWLRGTPWSQGKRLAVIDQTRDFPHQEQSARVNAVVAEFLDEEAASAARTG